MSNRVLGALLLLVAFGLVGPAGAASAVTVAGAPGPPTFEDDFDRPAGPVGAMWLVGAAFGSGPVVEMGQVTQGEPSNFWENLVWSAPLDSDAIWLEVDVVDAAVPFMLVLHHDGDASTPAENNGYGLRWQPLDQRVVVLKDGEYRGPHATSGGPYAGPHTLRAEWDGTDHIRFLVDGEDVMEWRDEVPPTLGGPDRRRVGVMFPPIGAAVHIEAVRGGTLDASVASPSAPPTTSATAALPTTSAAALPTTPATAAPPSSTAPIPAAPATVDVVDNDFIPESDLDDCVSALPRPDCGSEDRSGWRQWAILGLLVVAIAFIGWRIVRSARRSRPDPSTNHHA
jgi:hypothetical protein